MTKEPADCEYLIEGRLCSTIAEQPEGTDVRERLCKNKTENYCCYLCGDRENCEISCSFLDTRQESANLGNGASAKIEQEIEKYNEEEAKLAVLFADGKIGERSYLIAKNTLDGKIEALEKTKESPELSRKIAAKLEKKDEPQETVERPSGLWYLVPFLFGIVGGIIAYVGTKDRDKGMADVLLVSGIIWSAIGALISYVWILSIL